VRHRCARHEERAVDVGVDDKPPGLRIDFPEPRRLGHEALAHVLHAAAGIVDDDVEPPEARECGVHRAVAVLLTSDVGDVRMDPLAPGGKRIHLPPLARGKCHHVDASPGEAQRHRPAEPASGAGNDRDLF
jgi:hypothetical protein